MSYSRFGAKQKSSFIDPATIDQLLDDMENDSGLMTNPTPVKDFEGHVTMMGFHETHTNYLVKHPNVNPEHYLANLRAMIKIR